MNYEELKNVLCEEIKSTQRIINNIYIDIGKLTVERNCTEEEAKELIVQKKGSLEHFRGVKDGIEYAYHRLLELTVVSGSVTEET